MRRPSSGQAERPRRLLAQGNVLGSPTGSCLAESGTTLVVKLIYSVINDLERPVGTYLYERRMRYRTVGQV